MIFPNDNFNNKFNRSIITKREERVHFRLICVFLPRFSHWKVPSQFPSHHLCSHRVPPPKPASTRNYYHFHQSLQFSQFQVRFQFLHHFPSIRFYVSWTVSIEVKFPTSEQWEIVLRRLFFP